MRALLLAGAAALGLATLPSAVGAQGGPQATTNSAADKRPMNAEQQADYDTWPADRRSAYDRWTPDWQTYYWQLDPDQRTGWWVLNDEQRTTLYTMNPEQRTQAWASISQQMNAHMSADATHTGGTATSHSGTSAGMAGGSTNMAGGPSTMGGTMGASSAGTMSGNVRFVRNAVVQSVAADVAPANPPICGRGMTDNCINAWEAGKRGRGVNRPLDHWPGNRN